MTTGPMNAPWTEIGRLQQDVQSLENKLNGKADSYEISSLRSNVDHLEHTMREISSALDGFRTELQTLQENQIRQQEGE